MDSNTSENPIKTSTSPEMSFSNIAGHVTYTNVKGDNNQVSHYVSGYIKLGNKTLEKIDPVFQDSIKDFTDKLDALLKDKEISKQKVDVIKTNLTNLAKESQDIQPNEELKDSQKKDSIIKNLKDLAYNIAGLTPEVANKIAIMTPLAPFSEYIGKGVGYVAKLIQHKLSEP